jgi:diguanylate cyclase (GGDEF)-like protein/PAS domain S-box-containing protein
MFSTLYEKKIPQVLIANSSHQACEKLRLFLSSEGYGVTTRESIEEALTIFEQEHFRVILLEMGSRFELTLEACRQLKSTERGQETFVFFTLQEGVEAEAVIDLIYEAGAEDYFSQPLHLKSLHQRIKRVLKAQEVEKALEVNTAFSTSVMGHSQEGIVTLDTDEIIKYINPAATHMFGYCEGELDESPIDLILQGLLVTDFLSSWELRNGGEIHKEMVGRHQTKGEFPLEVSISEFISEDKPYYTLTLKDITAQKNYEEKIQYQAFYDDLTGLPNRTFLKERLSLETARARRNATKFAIMYLDVDRFKVINDTLGHEMGDLLLKELAERLKHAIRTDDLVARMGGDEFVIVLPGLYHVELVGKIASKILEIVKEPMLIQGNKLNVSISIGITVFPDDAEDFEVLLTYADIAMYRAKENGKDIFQTFTPELNAKAVERLGLENGLRQALENEEFVVYYQPKVNTITMKIVGMEALVRWLHPTLGLISPISFIPVAEETGLIVPLGAWVLKQACRDNQSLCKQGLPPITIAVNLSMRQFEAQNMVEMVLEILAETGMDPQYLELEITESIAVKNAQYTVSVIQELQKIGITFSIDDFGTGYSSLSQINSLSVDKLKIDRSFVSPIDGQKENAIIASTVLTLGKNLNMLVIAEGVETQAQVDFFKDNNCDEMQGYFIAKPMPWESFKALYQENLKLEKLALDQL